MQQTDPFEIDDAIVLLLGAPSKHRNLAGELQGVTRLEKLIFLMERETSAPEWLSESGDFVAYNFGPFSSKVYQAIDMLSAAGLVEDSGELDDSGEDSWERNNVIGDNSGGSDPYVTRDFALTERGRRYYEVLSSKLPKKSISELSDFKDKFANLPLRQLVRYVYQRYDDYTTRSVIRDQVLGPG